MLNATTLNDQVYQVLRDRILRWEVRPGQRLDVDDLSQGLGVSNTPVKDALRRLSVEGLVSIRPRRGTFVAEFTRKDLEELVDVRMMIELHAVDAGLPKASGEDDVRLRRTLELLESRVVGDGYADYQTFLDFDYQLHSCCVRLADNSQLLKIFEDTKLNLQLARANLMKPVGDARAAHREHAAIVIAFEERTPVALKAAFRQHEANRLAYLSGIFEQ